MKHFFLLLALSALASTSALAQLQRSARLQEYSRQLPASVNKTMRKAGLDIAAEKPPVTAGNNGLVLDSTKTFFAYDPTGSLDSTPLFRTIYDYLLHGVRYELEEMYDGLEWVPLYRTAYAYDHLERLVEVAAEYFDPEIGSFQPDSRLVVYPRGNSMELLDSFTVAGWNPDSAAWHVYLSQYNVFEDEDLLVESLTIIDLFGFSIAFKDVFMYNSNGDNFYTENFIIEEGEELLIGATETEYLDHLPIKIEEYTFTGFGFVPIARQEMGYTSFRALEKHKVFAWDFEVEAWLLTDESSYEYDPQQRLSAKANVTFVEEGAFYTRIEYVYLEGEYLALETELTRFEGLEEWILDTKTYYYYAGLTATPKVPIVRQELRVSPNPATDLVQLQLAEEAQVQLFDAAGRLKRQLRVLPGQSVDLSGLPAGLYFIAAQSGSALYNGKIVKQ